MNGDEHEVEYGLVMPFVLTKSCDGPFDDEAFVIGYLCGHIGAQLEALPDGATTYMRDVQSVAVPQLDLIAMRHGFTLTVEPSAVVEGWTLATFVRNALVLDETPPKGDDAGGAT